MDLKGRAAQQNPANRFERLHSEADDEHTEPGDDDAPKRSVPTVFYRDATRQIFSTNDSPDIPFDFSINPYRGCEHGCIYCYARPTHEYLGFSAGLDFETKILVKEDAPELLRQRLLAKSWQPQWVSLSGVTDPYQPIERKLRLTRRCLQVLAEFRNPVGIVTKNRWVASDIDVLAELAAHQAVMVYISITTLDAALQRKLEPRTSSPTARLDAIRELSAAGIPVGVMVAPIIPGLTEHEPPAILQAAAAAGAKYAGYVCLRLPLGVKDLFEAWLTEHVPDRKAAVLGRVRQVREGKLNDARSGSRMRGTGVFADAIRNLFVVAADKAGLIRGGPELSVASFRRPEQPVPIERDGQGRAQGRLFE